MKKNLFIVGSVVLCLMLMGSLTCYFLWKSKNHLMVEMNNKEIVYHRVDNSYNQFLIDDFNDVEDVYRSILPGDRVIFLVRHSERMHECGSEGGLSEHGIDLARSVGEKLKGWPFEDTSNDFYGSSIVKRTVETSYYVGEGRGSKTLEYILEPSLWLEYEFVNHSDDLNDVIYGKYFVEDYPYEEIYQYYERHKDDVNIKALRLVNVLCKMTEGHDFSWITSHDKVSLLLTERSTDETLSFEWSEWVNFMEGVAIIVHQDGGWEVYPVKSLSRGKISIQENPGCQ